MTQLTDLCIPRSALVFDGIDHASATAADLDTTQIGVLLQAVVQNHAASLVPADEIHTVSVTFDVSAGAAIGAEVQFASRIDRKTRTLIFASGLATQGDENLLKATLVFRIA